MDAALFKREEFGNFLGNDEKENLIPENVAPSSPTPGTKNPINAGVIESKKRDDLAGIMEKLESPDAIQEVLEVEKSPPRRATRKLKRVQLTGQVQKQQVVQGDQIMADPELEPVPTVSKKPPRRRKRKADVQMGPEPRRPKTAQKTKQNNFLLTETDHARCINSEKPPVTPSKSSTEEWREIQVNLISPMELIGRRCKVFWPKDDQWYPGTVHEYRSVPGTHLIEYDDNHREWIQLSKHRVQFRLGVEQEMKLRSTSSSEKCDADELMILADDREDVLWASIRGWPAWPAVLMDEEHAVKCGLAANNSSLPVQFFGTSEFSRVHPKNLVAFDEGIRRNYHTKSKRPAFNQALKEVERFFKEGKVPDKMVESVEKWSRNKREKNAADEPVGDETVTTSIANLPQFPLDLGDLRILSLGTIVTDSKNFHNKKHIWPEGYTSVRKFPSLIDDKVFVDYRMEVLRARTAPSLPTFRVTPSDTEAFEERTANECWKHIYSKLDAAVHCPREPGINMFGFGNPRVVSLIQRLPNASACTKFTGWQDNLYKPIDIQWKHLERCNVCYVEEEYVDNLFLQCAKCRMMVHMACYGESETPNGDLWLCQLCERKERPACCLCPITGGAMKMTTDDRWAHLTCATWIPETCLVDVKKMEPIGGVNSISKKRLKLLCSLCQVPYGACIQCAHLQCPVSYHPLCARAAGLHMEYREEGEKELQLLSFCRKHGPFVKAGDEKAQATTSLNSTQSGCSRCEPYHLNSRRGRQEPEAQALAAAKRLFVQNAPYQIVGFKRNTSQWRLEKTGKVFRSICETPRMDKGDEPVLSLSTRFEIMRASLRQRLCFGKSKIHGWGIFTKQEHQAGDLVAEYVGEIVRPVIADMREKRHYDRIVGAGTYMFRIDDERVVDATRAGSIAHLINHSCEPNCHSRIITVEGVDHITICAKRDILSGEELTYDYRFTSQGEELNCNCGSSSCRGSVRRTT